MRRRAKVVECSQKAQDEWVKTIRETAIDNTQFQRECTPGYYNNEGEEKTRWFLGEPYWPGFYAFDKLIQEWREQGDMAGLVIETRATADCRASATVRFRRRGVSGGRRW